MLGASTAQFAIVALTVLGLWIGARALVDSTVRIARRFGVSELTIGGTIVAAGTSTPELAVPLVAMRESHVGMSVGSLVGGNRVQCARYPRDRGADTAARGRRRGDRDAPLAGGPHGGDGRGAVVGVVRSPLVGPTPEPLSDGT
ncbi:hypothetical protein [Halorubrum lipolyticum]|uniref:hypothetical protein n=1 Tax=Halorubrum lipolyticum TaxID=368624 RepID=UPI001F4D2E01|nr:hypothetical protein [Halorubrum lipolyticum]